MKNNIVITIILVIVVGAGAFYGGMKYQQSQRSGFARQFGSQGGTRTGGSGGTGNRPVYGSILASDDKSITVKLQDGSSKIVLVTSSTSINKAATGTKDDLKVGEQVGVFGAANADGSVTAQNIQLNPVMRGGAGGGRPAGN